MKATSRRSFLTSSVAGGVALSMASSKASADTSSRPLGANDAVRVAIIGMHSKGKHHIQMYHDTPGVRIAALCDVDRDVLNEEVQHFTDRGEKVDAYVDARRMLEDKDIDAVSIATPNHWHSLLAIWACQAGKDVYVEKPVSHNIWEGRQLVEAARKYDRIVQAGTQTRSDQATIDAFDYIQKGNLGKLLLARGFCYKRRPSIGKVNGPQPIPRNIDYDLWTGPAPLKPLKRENLHYDWHWVWSTGNGDIGNQGIHQMDMCRWALGQESLAPRVIALGGRYGYVDDGKTANTQIAFFDYKPAPLIFEVRGLPHEPGGETMDHYRTVRVGIVLQCENGYYAGSSGGGWAYDNQGKKIKQFTGTGMEDHVPNFIQAVRSRKRTDLNAEIREGHLSSALCHMANLSYRLGHRQAPDKVGQEVAFNADLAETYERFREHLKMNQVDLDKELVALGPWLEMDPSEEHFVGDGEWGAARWANELSHPPYREPFVVPEKV